MAKRPTSPASDLTIRERLLLFCVASDTDWRRAGISEEIATAMVVKGLVLRDALGRLALTARGHAALRALLPDFSGSPHE